MYQTITEEAWELVHSIATQSVSEHGIGTMSSAAYDTAWVAMTEKKGEDGKSRPLFPEAYDYLKKTQSEDGSWAAETSDADGIINTLAALLALKRQERKFEAARADNEKRCRAAEIALQRMLSSWDLDATDRVGLEILVPNLLKLLETEGIRFDFPSKEPLMALNAAKLARLGPVLTSPVQTTLIHTLEAFVGTLDYDKVKQHKMPNGSMLASPSSTAAYLMNSSVWDTEAESYLRMVFEQQSSIGQKGGFPSAFPSTLFETSWVLDTLLESGFNKDDFLLADIRKLTVLLEKNLKTQKGLIGFAPSSLPDADDTAKAISALRLLGWNTEVQPMLKAFETDACFITYRGERNASSSVNCNILSCLLRTPDPAKYTKQIVKCVSFLTEVWKSNNGPDKWHTSIHYLMMLIAKSFILFLKRWGKKELNMESVPAKLIHQDIPRTLLDILCRTMRLQQPDGSWESKREVTAYAVLTLAPLLGLPWVDFMKPEGIACMYRGKAYLENNRHRWREAERLWIEKTVYSSGNLSQAYCLAASKIVVPATFMSQAVAELFPAQLTKKMTKMSDFFSRVIPFSGAPKWKLQLSLLQSASYTAALREARYNIFPPIEKASDEKYQAYIPFTWIGCRDILSTAISAGTLWEMMLVSMFNFQVDAYMETVVWDQYQNRLPDLKSFIRALCSGPTGKRKRKSDSDLGGASKKVFGPNGVSNRLSNSTPNGTLNDVSNGNVKNHSNGNSGKAVNGVSNRGSNGTPNGSISGARHKRVDSAIDDGLEQFAVQKNDADMKTEIVNGTNDFEEAAASLTPNADVLEDNEAKTSKEKDGEIETVLTKFVNFALHHPKVLQSPPALQSWLRHELQTFLLAHITHMEDCAELLVSTDSPNESFTWEKPRTTFFNWVRTTSADHTSCPYSFVFFLCLIGDNGKNVITNVHQRYALEDACHHLATTCRQYNDFGSVVRDQEERNLNSVNFPEFDIGKNGTTSVKEVNEQRKRDLLVVAAYEKRCLDRVVGELEEGLDARVMEKLKMFIQVTDLYGQIYVAKDIGVRRLEDIRSAKSVVV